MVTTHWCNVKVRATLVRVQTQHKISIIITKTIVRIILRWILRVLRISRKFIARTTFKIGTDNMESCFEWACLEMSKWTIYLEILSRNTERLAAFVLHRLCLFKVRIIQALQEYLMRHNCQNNNFNVQKQNNKKNKMRLIRNNLYQQSALKYYIIYNI